MHGLPAHRARLAGHQIPREVVGAVLQTGSVHPVRCLVGELLRRRRGLGRLALFFLQRRNRFLGRRERLRDLRGPRVGRERRIQWGARRELRARRVPLFERRFRQHNRLVGLVGCGHRARDLRCQRGDVLGCHDLLEQPCGPLRRLRPLLALLERFT